MPGQQKGKRYFPKWDPSFPKYRSHVTLQKLIIVLLHISLSLSLLAIQKYKIKLLKGHSIHPPQPLYLVISFLYLSLALAYIASSSFCIFRVSFFQQPEKERKMVSPGPRRSGETLPCDFCTERIAVLYCRADSAKLCLFCDQHVHSANLLSRKHLRSQICDNCSSEPVSVRCSTDNLVLCQECDLDAHGSCSVSASHDRSPIEAFSGCPSALDLASLWGLDLDDKKANQSAPSIQDWCGGGGGGGQDLFMPSSAWMFNNDYNNNSKSSTGLCYQDLIVPNDSSSGGAILGVNCGGIVTASKSCGKQRHVIYKQLVELFKRNLPCGGGDNGGVDFENGGGDDDHGVVGSASSGGGGVVQVQQSVQQQQQHQTVPFTTLLTMPTTSHVDLKDTDHRTLNRDMLWDCDHNAQSTQVMFRIYFYIYKLFIYLIGSCDSC